MAGSFSDWAENAVMDHVFGRSSTALSTGANSTMFVALFNSTINDTWTPLSTGECAGSTYARVAVANSSANFTNSTAGSKQNKTEISFTTAAGADWGTVQSVALMDSSSTSTGNILMWADLDSSQVINSGNTVKFSTGSLVLTLA